MATLEETEKQRRTYFIILIAVAAVLGIAAAFIAWRLTQTQPTTPGEGEAAGDCQYNSTQARVQKDVNDPWAPSRNIDQGQSFRVGGFRNDWGVVCTDCRYTVTAPNSSTVLSCDAAGDGYNCLGQTVDADLAGTYRLSITTPGSSDPSCSASATVTVRAVSTPTPMPTPTPTPTPTSTINPAATATPTPTPVPTPSQLPQTAIIGDSEDKVVVGLVLTLMGIAVLRYAYNLRKNS